MAQSPAGHRRLRHGKVLPDHRYDPVGTQDLRLAPELLQGTRQDQGPVRHEGRQLRVLAEAAKTSGAGRDIRIRTGEDVCPAPARDFWQTDLDDGWGRADRLL